MLEVTIAKPAELAGGRMVEVARLVPGMNTGAYDLNDVVGDTVELIGVARPGVWTGTLIAVRLVDLALQSIETDIFFFNRRPISLAADDAAIDMVDASVMTYQGSVTVLAADYDAGADWSVATIDNLWMPMWLPDNGTLYAVVATRGTPTYGALDALMLKVLFRQD